MRLGIKFDRGDMILDKHARWWGFLPPMGPPLLACHHDMVIIVTQNENTSHYACLCFVNVIEACQYIDLHLDPMRVMESRGRRHMGNLVCLVKVANTWYLWICNGRPILQVWDPREWQWSHPDTSITSGSLVSFFDYIVCIRRLAQLRQ